MGGAGDLGGSRRRAVLLVEETRGGGKGLRVIEFDFWRGWSGGDLLVWAGFGCCREGFVEVIFGS